MTTLVYDGTWNGLLTAVFDLYERKLTIVRIEAKEHHVATMFAAALTVHTDDAKALRVWNGVKKYISAPNAHQLQSAFLSELPDIGQSISEYIQLTFTRKASPDGDYANAAVLRIKQVNKMVQREKHRMEAFIRFQLTKDALYYAGIEPDFNVIPLIVKHFKNRYADQRWLIYDIKRSYGIYYDLNTVEEIELQLSEKMHKQSEPDLEIFHEDEVLYQSLWKNYFKHVNISERKNTKLHIQHVPKRYWKHLVEKQE